MSAKPPAMTLSDGSLWHIGYSGHGATFCGVNLLDHRMTYVLRPTERAGMWCRACLDVAGKAA